MSTKTAVSKAAEAFPPDLRDRQARGKSFRRGESSSWIEEEFNPSTGADSHSEQLQRAKAIEILDTPQQLMFYALGAEDSIEGQRLEYTRRLCGFPPDLPQGNKRRNNKS